MNSHELVHSNDDVEYFLFGDVPILIQVVKRESPLEFFVRCATQQRGQRHQHILCVCVCVEDDIQIRINMSRASTNL